MIQTPENQFFIMSAMTMTNLDEVLYQQAFEKFTQPQAYVKNKFLQTLHETRLLNMTFTLSCGQSCTEY